MNPILLALDVDDIEKADSLARLLEPHVGGFKVGLELIISQGPVAVSRIAELGKPVFADVKLHDIPNTVRGAVRALAAHGARWVTVHASGGLEMIEAANEGSSGECGILGVTVLTSLDSDDLARAGVPAGVHGQVERLTVLASEGGAEGVVCSPLEASLVKTIDSRLLAVTPGIRTTGSGLGDQKRVNTPEDAIASGADYLVIGRSITGAEDPVQAAALIVEGLSESGLV